MIVVAGVVVATVGRTEAMATAAATADAEYTADAHLITADMPAARVLLTAAAERHAHSHLKEAAVAASTADLAVGATPAVALVAVVVT
jgi:hypothetical protein